MKIVLIRHGATAGNIEKRYIGITDDDLCAFGIEGICNNIKAGYYQEVQALFNHIIPALNTSFLKIRNIFSLWKW
jgi:bisphosphoglycerate-dependent phosphoglycerate mutase